MQKELENFERKITSQVKEAINSCPANEIRISVQKELESFKKEIASQFKQNAATKPNTLNSSPSPAAVTLSEPVKPIPNNKPIKSTAVQCDSEEIFGAKLLSSAKPIEKATAKVDAAELHWAKSVPSNRSNKSTATG